MWLFLTQSRKAIGAAELSWKVGVGELVMPGKRVIGSGVLSWGI
jgi:hypothetical protein